MTSEPITTIAFIVEVQHRPEVAQLLNNAGIFYSTEAR